ncbi:MAG: CRISPR-associated endonuclease Cas2 [Candidatus Jorgensenbacteria bacterium]
MRKNSKPYHVLKTVLAAGGVLLISAVSPTSGALIVRKLIKQYLKNKKIRKERFLQDLKRLQDRKLIDYVQLPDGKIKITLTKLGKNKILTYDLDQMKLEGRPWDGKWRLVTFDVPDHQKNARNALRAKVKELGFYPLQKSVFITPHKCEDEIDFICSVFEIDRNNVLILEVGNFEGAEKLKHHFHL